MHNIRCQYAFRCILGHPSVQVFPSLRNSERENISGPKNHPVVSINIFYNGPGPIARPHGIDD